MIFFAAFGLCEWFCAKCNPGPLVRKDRWLMRKVGLCARSGIICNSESDGELVRVKAFTQCLPRRCEYLSRTLQSIAGGIQVRRAFASCCEINMMTRKSRDPIGAGARQEQTTENARALVTAGRDWTRLTVTQRMIAAKVSERFQCCTVTRRCKCDCVLAARPYGHASVARVWWSLAPMANP